MFWGILRFVYLVDIPTTKLACDVILGKRLRKFSTWIFRTLMSQTDDQREVSELVSY